ncbi:Inhibitor of growth protein 1 [Araneus ventricosus]|uniref:Inhibitor of growth protein 1 n=1 Tax=Araneus ventricosus TaxID=182803 RepID=A0A4Y2C8D5_ARAVE|nr:Inhibitor of growth protein 1 [Araneus ventricosus]
MFVNQKSELDSNKMLNQAALEAMYSAIYIEDYMDFIDNVPDDIQRNITQLRELDLRYQEILQDLDTYENALRKDLDAASRKRTLLQIQRALIQSQDLGDRKLQIVQVIQDIIDNKSRQLETDRKKLGWDGPSFTDYSNFCRFGIDFDSQAVKLFFGPQSGSFSDHNSGVVFRGHVYYITACRHIEQSAAKHQQIQKLYSLYGHRHGQT